MERKEDARKKLQIGNLVVMVGLDYMYPRELKILYGMLVWSKYSVQNNPKILDIWKDAGHDMLTGKLKADKRYKAQPIMNRKADARKKIWIGGLFVKAGLDSMHPKEAYVLYGMLLWCKEVLQANPSITSTWKEAGRALEEAPKFSKKNQMVG